MWRDAVRNYMQINTCEIRAAADVAEFRLCRWFMVRNHFWANIREFLKPVNLSRIIIANLGWNLARVVDGDSERNVRHIKISINNYWNLRVRITTSIELSKYLSFQSDIYSLHRLIVARVCAGGLLEFNAVEEQSGWDYMFTIKWALFLLSNTHRYTSTPSSYTKRYEMLPRRCDRMSRRVKWIENSLQRNWTKLQKGLLELEKKTKTNYMRRHNTPLLPNGTRAIMISNIKRERKKHALLDCVAAEEILNRLSIAIGRNWKYSENLLQFIRNIPLKFALYKNLRFKFLFFSLFGEKRRHQSRPDTPYWNDCVTSEIVRTTFSFDRRTNVRTPHTNSLSHTHTNDLLLLQRCERKYMNVRTNINDKMANEWKKVENRKFNEHQSVRMKMWRERKKNCMLGRAHAASMEYIRFRWDWKESFVMYCIGMLSRARWLHMMSTLPIGGIRKACYSYYFFFARAWISARLRCYRRVSEAEASNE